MAAATVRVWKLVTDAAGVPLGGAIVFEPSARVVDTTTGAERQITRVVGQVQESLGLLDVALTATTGPDVDPAGWLWKVTERLRGVDVQRPPYYIALPVDTPGGVLDLKDAAPVPGIDPVVYGPEYGMVFDGGVIE